MASDILFIEILLLITIHALVINNDSSRQTSDDTEVEVDIDQDLDNVFNGVYTECFLHLSYSCLQNKTLVYLKELNNLSEVSVIGDYMKFVKLNISKQEDENEEEYPEGRNTEELAYMIDKAIDRFFDNHVIKFSGVEREISMSNNDEFVGRKKRKGGGGGHGGHGDEDGGKKKMMMMAMMCMKMKLMMMVPAMMGMMGMMSFKGMMFSMMSFMVSKMMLLMKILEKKGAAAGGLGGGGTGDGGWAAASGGGGAWMPAGAQDYAGAVAGGGYDANGQWQSRSILEKEDKQINTKPIVTYVDPVARYSGKGNDKKPYFTTKRYKEISKDVLKSNRNKRSINLEYCNNNKCDETNIDNKHKFKGNSRYRRSIIDALQSSYVYWVSKILGLSSNRRTSNFPKQKIVNGVRYVYYPFRPQKFKAPREIQSNRIQNINDGFKSVLTPEDINTGEIVEGAVESRMNRKKFHKMKDTMNDTIDESPWE